MSCGGGHLEFSTGIKKQKHCRGPSNDHSWAVWFQEYVQMPSSQKLQIWLKTNCTWMFIGWSSTKFTFFVPIWNSKWRIRQDLVYFEIHIRTKNVKFVEDHPMNIHVQFGFNNICSFWEEGIWTFSHRVQC
jgi:hypothetical protein